MNLKVVAILIGVLVMMHGSVMSLDPHGQIITGYDAAHGTVMDLVCDESQAMSPSARIVTDSSSGVADVPRPDAHIFAPEAGTLRGWQAPAVTGDALRAMLQVFLN